MAYELNRETEMGGMFLDSGRLYCSSFRAYPTQFGMVCKDAYVIRAVRLIQNAQHTNQVITLCAGVFVLNCKSAGLTHV